jgi:CBS domain-containing protein
LPVVRGEELIGIVTTTDLLELLGRGTERPIARNKRFTLTHRPNKSARR